jgi:hypothetical protein
MRLTHLFVCAFMLTATAAPAAQLGDGADLPAPGAWPVELKGLPKSAPLGGSPADLLRGQAVYSARKNSAELKKMRAMIDDGVYGFKLEKRDHNYQWYTVHLLGADAAAFDLEAGRIFRLGYFFQKLPKSRAEAAIKEFAKLDPKADVTPKPDPDADKKTPPPSPTRCVITLEGVRLVCSIQRPVGLAGEEPNSPGMIVYHVQTNDWYLLSHKPDDETAQAIRDGKILLGMNEEQAIAAMPECKVQRDASANERLVWLTFHSPLRESSLPVAKVYLSDGVVKDVQQYHRADEKPKDSN